MEDEKKKYPIKMNLSIENASLKRIVEEGRLMEFVDALSAQASAHIKTQVIDQIAKGVIAQGGSLSVVVGFEDDNRYGTKPPRPWPWPPKGIWEDAMRQVAIESLVKEMKSVK
jgi:hypothetical protein